MNDLVLLPVETNLKMEDIDFHSMEDDDKFELIKHVDDCAEDWDFTIKVRDYFINLVNSQES